MDENNIEATMKTHAAAFYRDITKDIE